MTIDPQLLETPLVIGTRGSDLALWQSRHVAETLRRQWGSGLEIRLEVISTKGDQIQDRPLQEVGGKGLFVKAIEDQLLSCHVDLAVHSMKDMPAVGPKGLVVACTPKREDARDAMVGRDGVTGISLGKLAKGTRVGTGSLRRGALVRRANANVEVVPVRGNVPTRVGLVDSGEVDVVILAAAGLTRLGMDARITEYLDVERFVPSPAQGILALQCRDDDTRVKRLLRPMQDRDATICATAERAFLERLEASCTVPLGCYAELRAPDVLTVAGLVVDPSGRPCFVASKMAHPDEARALGYRLADNLMSLGADRILASTRAVA